MTRDEVLSEFTVSPHGTITSPGKFEGCMVYMPAAWDIYMNGFSDDEYDEHEVLVSTVEIDGREWPEVRDGHKLNGDHRYLVTFYEDDQGFVNELEGIG